MWYKKKQKKKTKIEIKRKRSNVLLKGNEEHHDFENAKVSKTENMLNLSKSAAAIWGKFQSEAVEELITAAFTGYIVECQPRLFDDTSTSVT